MALEAVQRIDALFDIERALNGLPPSSDLPAVGSTARRWLPRWKPGCASERRKLSRHSDVAKAPSTTCSNAGTSFARFLEDGRICLTNNAAERALRGLALGRKAWLFAAPIVAASARRSSTA
jgi:hypothetical protein